jgi:hypothetical protein
LVPFVKVLGLVGGWADAGFKCCVNEIVQTLDLFLLGQNSDVILEGVRDPNALVPDVRDALVLVPVVRLGQGFVEAVVKVLVVREDDVAANIEELLNRSARHTNENRGVRALRSLRE